MPDTMRRKTPLAAHLMRAVSVEAPADPRTVRKVLLGEAVSPLARDRILRALEARGLSHLVRAGRVEGAKPVAPDDPSNRGGEDAP
jgi:hypothetical protein